MTVIATYWDRTFGDPNKSRWDPRVQCLRAIIAPTKALKKEGFDDLFYCST